MDHHENAKHNTPAPIPLLMTTVPLSGQLPLDHRVIAKLEGRKREQHNTDAMWIDRAISFAYLMFEVIGAVESTKAEKSTPISTGNILSFMTLPVMLADLKRLISLFRKDRSEKIGALVERLYDQASIFLPLSDAHRSVGEHSWVQDATDAQFNEIVENIERWLKVLEHYKCCSARDLGIIKEALSNAESERKRLIEGGAGVESPALVNVEAGILTLSLLTLGLKQHGYLEMQLVEPLKEVAKDHLRDTGFALKNEALNPKFTDGVDVPIIV